MGIFTHEMTDSTILYRLKAYRKSNWFVIFDIIVRMLSKIIRQAKSHTEIMIIQIISVICSARQILCQIGSNLFSFEVRHLLRRHASIHALNCSALLIHD